jgi:glycosyltransferase domain-containing protein
VCAAFSTGADSAVSGNAPIGSRDDLTVVLTLKGREAFTPRWIDYHKRVGLPWPVLVGDGLPSERTEAQFARAAGLRATYRRYDDSDLLAFYRKLRDLVAATSTPYVLLSDNDDFVLPQGVTRCIRFLDENPDYVSCSGEILGMYVTDDSFADKDRIYGGVVYRLKSIYKPLNRNEDDAEERVTTLLLDYVATWYAVHRRDALLKVFSDLVERKISDIALMELLVAAELAALGKHKTDSSCASYLRQLNSSQGAASTGGLFVSDLSPSVERDIAAMARSLAAIANGKTDETGRVSRMRAAIMRYREGRMTAPIAFGTRIGRFVGRYLHTQRAKAPALRAKFSAYETRRLFAGLRAHGATGESIAALQREFDLVWRAVGHRKNDTLTEAAICGSKNP